MILVYVNIRVISFSKSLIGVDTRANRVNIFRGMFTHSFDKLDRFRK